AFAGGRPSPLPELSIQYADYAIWQREWLQGKTLERQLTYWREQLRGVPDALQLPTDRPRRDSSNSPGASESVNVSGETLAELKALSQRAKGTLFMTLLAAMKVWLQRYTG